MLKNKLFIIRPIYLIKFQCIEICHFFEVFSQRHKYRHIDQQGDNRECCTTDSGDGKGKPKDLLWSIVEERDKSQDGGDDGQQDWDNLMVKCLEIKARAALRRYHLAGVVLVDNINSSIHHDTAQQHKRSKTSLVETEA